jgi:hypothetical protein
MRQLSMERIGITAVGIVTLFVFAASANAAKPGWSVKPTKLNFGSSPAGVASNALSVTVTNISGVTEQVAGAHVMTGDLADFNVQGSSSCVFPAPVFVGPGGTCTVDVVFNPQAVGTFKATLQIDLNPGPPATVALTGRGT